MNNPYVYLFICIMNKKYIMYSIFSIFHTTCHIQDKDNIFDFFQFQLQLELFCILQIFQWNNGIFIFHNQLSVNGGLSLDLFPRGSTTYLVIVPCESMHTPLLFKWSENDFIRFQEVPINGITQVKAVVSGSDIYLIFAKGTHI